MPSWALGSRGVGRARNRNWTLLIHGVKLLASHQSTVAKQIGGWKSDTIYERYRIVSEADLQDAGKKLDRRNGTFGHSLGIVEPKIPRTNTEKSASVV